MSKTYFSEESDKANKIVAALNLAKYDAQKKAVDVANSLNAYAKANSSRNKAEDDFYIAEKELYNLWKEKGVFHDDDKKNPSKAIIAAQKKEENASQQRAKWQKIIDDTLAVTQREIAILAQKEKDLYAADQAARKLPKQ